MNLNFKNDYTYVCRTSDKSFFGYPPSIVLPPSVTSLSTWNCGTVVQGSYHMVYQKATTTPATTSPFSNGVQTRLREYYNIDQSTGKVTSPTPCFVKSETPIYDCTTRSWYKTGKYKKMPAIK